MNKNIIHINDFLPVKEKTKLKVIMFPEKPATVKSLKNSVQKFSELQLKHPDLPECNSAGYRERDLF